MNNTSRARVAMGYSFGEDLYQSIVAYKVGEKVYDPEGRPDETERINKNISTIPEKTDPNYKEFRRNFAFRSGMAKFTGSDQFYDSPQAHFAYWIALAKEKCGPNINLVLAKDDILNEKSHDEEISKLPCSS